jgi:glutathione peroxidase-family protein
LRSSTRYIFKIFSLLRLLLPRCFLPCHHHLPSHPQSHVYAYIHTYIHTYIHKLTLSPPRKQDLKQQHPDFIILGFPCNQFNNQDPGTNDEIQSFCQVNYGVTFPVLGKIDVNGDNADPAFEWLKHEKPGMMGLKRVKWNFEKFLVGRDGKVKQRWASTTKPEALRGDIEKALKEKK